MLLYVSLRHLNYNEAVVANVNSNGLPVITTYGHDDHYLLEVMLVEKMTEWHDPGFDFMTS